MVLVLLAGCSEAPPPPLAIEREVVAEAAEGRLAITAPGLLDNRAPVPFGPSLSWMPIAWVAPDGARVGPDDDLVRFDLSLVNTWIRDQSGELVEQRETLARVRLEQEKRLAELEQATLAQRAEAAAAAAKLATDRADEPANRRFAEERLALAETAAARMRARLAAAEGLQARGNLSPRDLADARSRAWSAQADLLAARRESASFTEGTRAAERARLELALDRVGRAIAAGGGAEARLDLARRQAEAERTAAAETVDRLQDQVAQRIAFAADPRVPSATSGLIKLKNEETRRGNKLPATPCLFVLEDEELVARVLVPGHLRDLVALWTPERPDHGLARVMVPALGPDAVWNGRVLAVAAAPEDSPAGRRYATTLRLDPGQDLSRLKPGMQAEAELLLPVHGAALPAWAVHTDGDPRTPLVRLAGGDLRRVGGVAIPGPDGDADATRFLVLSGLAPGERVVALGTDGVGAAVPLRLTGVVDAADDRPITLSSGNWEVIDVVPDGALVEAGAVVAKLWKNAFWLQPEETRRNHRTRWAKINAQRTANELRADQDLLRAVVDWWNARATWRDKLLGERLDGAAARDERLVRAERSAADGASEAARLEAEAAALADPAVAQAFSRQAQAAKVLAAARARARADQAALDLAAARSDPPALDAWAKAAERLQARIDLAAAEGEWQQASARHAKDLERADRDFRREREDISRQGRELVDEVLVAPAQGRIFHKQGLVLKAGVPLRDRSPLRLVPEIPGVPALRKLELELPAHLASRWRTGQAATVHVPGVGAFSASVSQVATRFGLSKAAQAEAEAGGATLADDQVCDLVLRFSVPPDQVALVLPGVPAYVE